MQTNRIQQAIAALEAEREKLTSAIDALRKLEGGSNATPRITVPGSLARKRTGRGKMTAAGREKLAESARRRWVLARKQGKTTL